MDIQHFSALTPLLELKERTEFVSLSSVIFEMIKQEQAENREILGEFPLDNDVNLFQWLKNSVKTLFLMLKHAFNIAWEFLLYDLKGYDSAFSFADPPSLAISHLPYRDVKPRPLVRGYKAQTA